MAIVTGLTKRLDIPHENGAWIMIKQLSWREKQKARDLATDTVFARFKTMGTDLMREMQGAEARPEVQARLADPTTGFDPAAILHAGIVQWSYDEPVTVENVDQLDEDTAQWALREIVAFSGPLSEEDRKNVSSPST